MAISLITPRKHKKLSSIPSTHIKSQTCRSLEVTDQLSQSNQQAPGVSKRAYFETEKNGDDSSGMTPKADLLSPHVGVHTEKEKEIWGTEARS